MNLFRCCVLACSALFCAVSAQEALEDVRTPGFRVTFDEQGWLRVWFRSIPFVAGANFSAARPGWQGNLFPGRSQKWQTSVKRDGDTRTLEIRGVVKEGVSCATTVTVRPDEIAIEHDYQVEAAAGVGFIYSECFFDRDLLDGVSYKDQNGKSGVLRKEDVGTCSSSLKTVDFSLPYGTLRVEVSQDQSVAGEPKNGGWELRNVSDRTWGPDDRKTFSIPNVFERSGSPEVHGKTVYKFTFSPDERLGVEVSRRLEKLQTERDAKMAALADSERAMKQRREPAGGAVFYPAPQEMQRLQGVFPLTTECVLTVEPQAGAEVQRIAERLQREWLDYCRVSANIRNSDIKQRRAGQIWMGVAGTSPRLDAEFQGIEKKRDQVHTPHAEGYRLEVRPEQILLLGDDLHGLWYGVQALMQIPVRVSDGWAIPCLSVRDWPDFEVRAMMLTLGRAKQIGFLKHTIRRVLPRMRVNMAFIGGASIGRVTWPSHPDVGTTDAFTPAQIRELADLCRENFIEPVPHVQGFGHTGPLKGSHPELLAPLESGRTPCFDITKPEVRAFIFDLYQDAVEAFRPEGYFHVGFDEAMGLQAVAGDREPAAVIAEHITVVNSWLNDRGLRMIMWSDMLLDKKEFGASSAANSLNPHYGNVNTAPAIDMIPKNVMQANWYYGGAEEHPQLGFLTKKGFEVFPTTWYRPDNNYLFLKNSKKAGLRWASGSSWMYCSANNPTMMGALLGEYSWTAGRPALNELSYDQLALLSDLLKPPRLSDVSCQQIPIDLAESANRSCVDSLCGDDAGWLDLGPMRDMSVLKPGLMKSARYEFMIPGDDAGARCVLVRGTKAVLPGVPTEMGVSVGTRADALVFLHASNLRSVHMRSVGQYEVRYADGSSVEIIPLTNTVSVSPWIKPGTYGSWRQERQKGYCRDTTLAWKGYTLSGEKVELTAFEWRNPHPDRVVKEIRITVPDHGKDAVLALCGLTVLSEK